jgi:hypothetical protein
VPAQFRQRRLSGPSPRLGVGAARSFTSASCDANLVSNISRISVPASAVSNIRQVVCDLDDVIAQLRVRFGCLCDKLRQPRLSRIGPPFSSLEPPLKLGNASLVSAHSALQLGDAPLKFRLALASPLALVNHQLGDGAPQAVDSGVLLVERTVDRNRRAGVRRRSRCLPLRGGHGFGQAALVSRRSSRGLSLEMEGDVVTPALISASTLASQST